MGGTSRAVAPWKNPNKSDESSRFMCQRYAFTAPADNVRAYFDHVNVESYPPRYNIAATQPILIVRHNFKFERELVLVRWGLVPSWVKDPRDFTTIVNARAETASVKPSFRAALRHRRCLIPATGFYEWTGSRGAKQPHLASHRESPLMAFAGLWEHWLGGDGSEFESAAILTVPANREMAPIHDRMPLILEPDNYAQWLECRSGSTTDIEHLLKSPRDGILNLAAVSTKLNNWRNECPEVQEPVTPPML